MPASSLHALLGSPAASASNETINGRTLPDITLGSLGSSFRSEDDEERRERLGKPVSRGTSLLLILQWRSLMI
jgi:hypothetical protein